MRALHSGAISSIASFVICAASAAQPAAPTAKQTDDGVVLVRTFEVADKARMRQLDARVGVLEVVWESKLVPGLRAVRVNPQGKAAAIATYKQDASVRYAEPDYVMNPCGQSVPYGVTLVGAPVVWPQQRGDGVIVANLDTGIDLGHPDLPAPALTQSFIPGESVQDVHSHGTHTIGTILAADNDFGVVGVAPQATLIVGKVLSNAGPSVGASVLQGVEWAALNDAKVISMSLGGYGYSFAAEDLYDAVLASGVLVVAAAGNDNTDVPLYPASYPAVLSVAAVDSNKLRAGFSNFGSNISVSAPGVAVLSTVPSGNVAWGGVPHTAFPMSGSGSGPRSGAAVYCGLGLTAGDFPASVSGKIAHIRRGQTYFEEKVLLARAAGAIGVVISNNVPGIFAGTLQTFHPVPVVSISKEDGDELQALSGITAVIATTGGHGYDSYQGTSMACPHVAGVAALLLQAYPSATPAQVRAALEFTATDLGETGRDDFYGWGLVNARAAKGYLDAVLGLGACCNALGACTATTAADCEATFIVAGSCSPNPCARPLGPCCHPDGLCQMTTPDECAAVWGSQGVCTPNFCTDQATGACCKSGACAVVLRSQCTGVWVLGHLCEPSPCALPTGTCCKLESCTLVIESLCTGGGIWSAGGSCLPNPCPQPTGACCADGTCQVGTRAQCASQWIIGGACSPNPCPQPTGACCKSGDCLILTPAACATAGGTYRGAGVGCTSTLCSQVCPTITLQPVGGVICADEAVTLSINATGTPPPAYQWRRNGVPIQGANKKVLRLAAGTAQPGRYDCVASNFCGSAVSDRVLLNVVRAAPSITEHPAPASLCAGESLTLRVRATGDAGRTFQWRRNGTPISGANANTYFVPSVKGANAGRYDCVVTNPCGSATSNKALVNVTPGVPQITQQPPGRVEICGKGLVNLQIQATGGAAKTFQWRKNGEPISGQTADSVTVTISKQADAGSFDCVVTNVCGSTASNAATVVFAAGQPQITQGPTGQVVCVGESLTLQVQATGGPGRSFEWSRNGQAIGGADSNPQTFENPLSGEYTCTVTNPCGSATSEGAAIDVEICDPAARTAVRDCLSDFNLSGAVTSEDVFGFMESWFARSRSADVDKSGSVNLRDLYEFLASWLTKCPSES